MSAHSLHSVERERRVPRQKAVVLLAGGPGSRSGTLLVHVEEQDDRLVAGDWVLAIPVHVGQPAMEVAMFASTQAFQSTQTIFLGGVMLSLSPELLQEVGAALRIFVQSESVP